MQPAGELSGHGLEESLFSPGPGLLGMLDLRDPVGAQTQARVAARSLSVRGYVGWLVAADATAAVVGVFGALAVRFSGSPATIDGISYLALVPAFLLSWSATMWLGGSYDRRILVSGPEEFRRVLNGAVWMLAAVALIGFAAHVAVSRTVIAMTLLLATLLSLGARYGARRLIQGRLRRGATLYRAVVVGTMEEAQGLTGHMKRNAHAGFSVTAVLVPPRRVRRTTRQRIDEILTIVGETGADTIVVAGSSGFTSSQLRELAWGLEGSCVRLLMAPALTDLAGPRISMHPVGGLPLLHIREPEFTGPKLVMKRCMDLVGGTVLLVLLLPVLVAIAVAVLLGSGRPVFYTQTRVGRHGDHFRMVKFRTMTTGADEMRGQTDVPATPVRSKVKRDPRVTRVGGILRRYSLDELPQFLNVVAGSMSLVGPRPHRPCEVAEYQHDVLRRLLIKPGVTGLWQVSGRAALSWDEAVRLDLHYVENWSVWLDVLLILKTARAVVVARGAY